MKFMDIFTYLFSVFLFVNYASGFMHI